ncbi:MAG: hypothetical protein AAGA58_04300 [Verrucomicrobiota bacterium]
MTARTDILQNFAGFDVTETASVQTQPDRRKATFWFALVALAFAGTAAYAASGAPFLPAVPAWESMIILVIATGGAWVVFGLGAVLWLHLRFAETARISLLTMAVGEAVLLATATVNAALFLLGYGAGPITATVNIAGLMAADALMAITMTHYFVRAGLHPLHAAVLWIGALHGTAIVLALVASHVLL